MIFPPPIFDGVEHAECLKSFCISEARFCESIGEGRVLSGFFEGCT